jgi:CheY-like chemotaxis protein
MGGARVEPSGDEQQAGSTILVVEDEVLLRMVIADNLRNSGYTVLEASNADEALEVLRHSSGVTVVFTDIRMPGSMDGTKFAGFVRSEYPVLKIVLTSGDLAALDGAEHDGFFLKPYDGGKVIQHIKALLTEERTSALNRCSI